MLPAPDGPTLLGVLNVTPDSFSDGGHFLGLAAASNHATALAAAGADVIDIGGESTAPGSERLSAAVELARIRGLVEALAPSLRLSIDTYHAATAARCLEGGAAIINDVSALRADPDMARVVAEHDAGLILMHSKEADGPPHATDRPHGYTDLIQGVGDFLARRLDAALGAGVKPERIVLDPGWGKFLSVDAADNWLLLRRFGELVERFHPVPMMVATSRKGFLGGPVQERDPLSALTGLAAVGRGATWIRTHNVALTRTFLDAGRALAL